MPNFIVTAGVTFAFNGIGDSTARTIPTADAVFLATAMWPGADPVDSTIAGAVPTESYQGATAGTDRNYLAVFVGAPSGSQTVAFSGGDGSSGWSCGFRGLDEIDTGDPFDGVVTDTASPSSISVVTTADGLACGAVMNNEAVVTTSDTEVFEGPVSDQSTVLAVASTPGTGGSVSLDWSGGFNIISIAVNLRHQAAGPSTSPMFRGS